MRDLLRTGMNAAEPLIQVFGLGQCSLDYIGKIDAYPPPDVKCEFYDLTIQGGGPVATALVALARWGVSCAIAGVLGDDLFGKLIKTSLDEEKVDTSGLMIRKGGGSQFAFIVAEPGAGRRTIFWRRPTGMALRPEEINYSRLRQARVFHTDGLLSEAALAAARVARDAGVEVVVDAGTLREGMLDLARLSDYFIASEPFATALAGSDNLLEACRKLAEFGPQIVAVTLGAKGYMAMAGGKVFKGPAYPVKVIDTTGCGDVFHAGFVYGVIRRWNPEKILDFAAWSAAMVSREMGGRTGIPSLEQIREKGYS